MTPVTNLLLFLSDRCNMACDYCFLSLNRGRAVVLDEAAAFAACEAHLERAGAAARFTLLGGEPLLHFPLLQKIVARIRTLAPEAPVAVVTNGTLLTPERLDVLEALRVAVTVSVDGDAATHDAHRPMAGGGPSLARTLEALGGRCPCEFKANLVLCEDTAPALLRSVEAVRALGFGRLSFHLNVLQPWSPEGLVSLRGVLDGFVRYYAALQAATPGALEVAHLPCCAGKTHDDGPDHPYEDLVLGADGKYYPCDAPLSLTYEKAALWAVGDVRAGVDWERREAFHDEARAYIHARQETPHHLCARETYFHEVCRGKDPDAAVRSFLRADAVFGEALSRLTYDGRPQGERIHV